MVRALRNRPEFSEKFMAYLLARNARVEADLVDQLFNSSEKRLARTGRLLMQRFAGSCSPEQLHTLQSRSDLDRAAGKQHQSFFGSI